MLKRYSASPPCAASGRHATHSVAKFTSPVFILGWMLATPALAVEDATDTLQNVALPEGLMTEVQQALPEGQDVNQEFLNASYNPNVTLQQEANMAVTFLTEGAGYRNSLGYFTFTDDTFANQSFGSIDSNNSGNISIPELSALQDVSYGMVFNNASASGSGGSLNPGDTVTLGGNSITNINGTEFEMSGGVSFDAGTNVGFFLLQNAWNGRSVNGIDNSRDPLTMYSVDFLNPENSSLAYLEIGIDEDARHVAMMSSVSADNELILGFEDLKRPWGDNDFNDAVFRIRTDPVTALFAYVPTTESVIAMQAAPAPKLGSSLLSLGVLLFAAGFAVRKQREATI